MSKPLTTVLGDLGAISASLWVGFAALLYWHRAAVAVLAEVEPLPPPGGWPVLAVLFAARNEATTVRSATLSLLAQEYPGLVVIAVDDRSTDATPAILHEIADADPRLRVVSVADLPPGWLGKNHALQVAADAAAHADWLLFTDADVLFEPSALRRAIAYASPRQVDHVIAAPDVLTDSPAERAFLAMFSLGFTIFAPPWRLIDPTKQAAAGVGAFNLVRREAFEAIGGFRHLRLSVDDDVRLGQALKFAGNTCALLLARQAVAVRWHVGVGGMVRGLEKNFFAALDFRLLRVAVGLAGLAFIGLLPYLGLVLGAPWERAISASGVLAIALILHAQRGQSGAAWYYALTIPFGALAMGYALVRSTAVTLWRGVFSRDRLYPLAELKAHVKERNAWLAEVWRSTR